MRPVPTVLSETIEDPGFRISARRAHLFYRDVPSTFALSDAIDFVKDRPRVNAALAADELTPSGERLLHILVKTESSSIKLDMHLLSFSLNRSDLTLSATYCSVTKSRAQSFRDGSLSYVTWIKTEASNSFLLGPVRAPKAIPAMPESPKVPIRSVEPKVLVGSEALRIESGAYLVSDFELPASITGWLERYNSVTPPASLVLVGAASSHTLELSLALLSALKRLNGVIVTSWSEHVEIAPEHEATIYSDSFLREVPECDLYALFSGSGVFARSASACAIFLVSEETFGDLRRILEDIKFLRLLVASRVGSSLLKPESRSRVFLSGRSACSAAEQQIVDLNREAFEL